MKNQLFPAISLLWMYLFLPAWAQEETSTLPAGFRSLNYTTQLPEKLLYTKSVVFIKTPASSGKNHWKDLAQQVHVTFREAGVDAVAYYYFDDVSAGQDASRKLADELKKRNIQNIIVVSQGERRISLLITPFNGESSFVADGQEAYRQEAVGIDQLLVTFGKVAYRSNMEVQNHLINDEPEFFIGAGNVIRGKRFEAFAQDLKLDKLAVPKFQETDLRQHLSDQESAEQQIALNNQKLESVMAFYPYEYSLVDPAIEEDKLRQDGYQYILLKLHTTEAHIKDMLGYKNHSGQQQKMPEPPKAAQGPVYKYYVKHIYTGDVYLGNLWDADEDWSNALSNYIRHMREGLNIGN